MDLKDGSEVCETDPSSPPVKPSSTATPTPGKKCIKTADVIILKDVDYSYDESEECETYSDYSPSPTPPPSPSPSIPETVRCRTLRELIDLKDPDEDDDDNEECNVGSKDTTLIVKPAITKPGKDHIKVRCKTLQNVVSLYDVDSEETFRDLKEDEECHISIESDNDVTTLNMKSGQSSEVENPCNSYPDIDPKLSKLVTLYDSLEDDCYSVPTHTIKHNVLPEVPADFVPRCGRHNEEGYLQSITKMDPDHHETQFGEWPGMCAILLDGEFIAGERISSVLVEGVTCCDDRRLPGESQNGDDGGPPSGGQKGELFECEVRGLGHQEPGRALPSPGQDLRQDHHSPQIRPQRSDISIS